MTSSRSIHNPAWSWWRSMWSLWRRGRRLNRTTPNNWGRPPWLVLLFYLFSSDGCPKSSTVAACSSLHGCLWLSLKCLCGLVMSLGQNRTCLWRTHSCCVLAPACSPSSSMMAPTLQAHIWWSSELSWRGEEVGADWHMTDRMWLEGVWKEEAHFRVQFLFG